MFWHRCDCIVLCVCVRVRGWDCIAIHGPFDAWKSEPRSEPSFMFLLHCLHLIQLVLHSKELQSTRHTYIPSSSPSWASSPYTYSWLVCMGVCLMLVCFTYVPFSLILSERESKVSDFLTLTDQISIKHLSCAAAAHFVLLLGVSSFRLWLAPKSGASKKKKKNTRNEWKHGSVWSGPRSFLQTKVRLFGPEHEVSHV